MGKAWGSLWSKGPTVEEVKKEENDDSENIEIQDKNEEILIENEIVNSGESTSEQSADENEQVTQKADQNLLDDDDILVPPVEDN